jgi:hypothetical protein
MMEIVSSISSADCRNNTDIEEEEMGFTRKVTSQAGISQEHKKLSGFPLQSCTLCC